MNLSSDSWRICHRVSKSNSSRFFLELFQGFLFDVFPTNSPYFFLRLLRCSLDFFSGHFCGLSPGLLSSFNDFNRDSSRDFSHIAFSGISFGNYHGILSSLWVGSEFFFHRFSLDFFFSTYVKVLLPEFFKNFFRIFFPMVFWNSVLKMMTDFKGNFWNNFSGNSSFSIQLVMPCNASKTAENRQTFLKYHR